MSRREEDLYPDFRRRLAELAPRARRLLAACSGGPDSMALWDLLERWKRDTGGQLIIGHVDHGLRGRASRADAAFVARRARALGTPCRIMRISVRGARRRSGGGIEETARRLRYRALAGLARSTGCRHVLTAHHLDDQVETLFLNLVRGAGPAGVGGMSPEGPWPFPGPAAPRLLRPLLAISRDRIMAYIKQRAITYRIDKSNRSPAFFRNRLRPVLRGWEQARPGFFRRAGRLAEILRDEEAYWVPRLRRMEKALLRRGAIDLRRLIRYHKVEQRRFFKHLFPTADFTALERLRAFALSSATGALSLPSGGAVRKNTRALVLTDRGNSSSLGFAPLLKEAPLSLPGRVILSGPRRFRIVAQPVKRLPAGWRRLAPERVFVDADRLEGRRLLCRAWRPGDRFQPLGMTGHKKLQDFFVDAGVPREQRPGVLVLEDKSGIVWVVGHRLSDAVKLTPATKRVLELAVETA